MFEGFPEERNEHWFNRYKKFILWCLSKRDNKKVSGYARHHILPKCLAGKNNPENLVYLSYREHFLAHYILSKSYPLNMNLRCAAGYIGNSLASLSSGKFFSISLKKISELYKEMVSVKDTRTGDYSVVPREQFLTNSYLVGVTKGLVYARDMEGITQELSCEEFKNNRENYTTSTQGKVLAPREFTLEHREALSKSTKGKVLVFDTESNEYKRVDKSSVTNTCMYTFSGRTAVRTDSSVKLVPTEEYKNSTLSHINTGKVVVKTHSGEIVSVTKEEFDNSTELVSIHKGMVCAVDTSTNENKYISKDEFYSNREKYKALREGLVTVYKKGTTDKVTITSEEYKDHKDLYSFREITDSERVNRGKSRKGLLSGIDNPLYGRVSVRLEDNSVVTLRREELESFTNNYCHISCYFFRSVKTSKIKHFRTKTVDKINKENYEWVKI